MVRDAKDWLSTKGPYESHTQENMVEQRCRVMMENTLYDLPRRYDMTVPRMKELYLLVAPFKTHHFLVHVPDACDCGPAVVLDNILRKLSTTLSRV
jgi:hypothetical protein